MAIIYNKINNEVGLIGIIMIHNTDRGSLAATPFELWHIERERMGARLAQLATIEFICQINK